jgi:hypothetical protein
VLQAVFGAVAVGLGVLGWDAAVGGGWRRRPGSAVGPGVATAPGRHRHVRAA